MARDHKEATILENSELGVILSLRDVSLILREGDSSDLSTCRTGVNLNLIADDVSSISYIYNFLSVVELIVSESLKSPRRYVLDRCTICLASNKSSKLIIGELGNSDSFARVNDHKIFDSLRNRALHHIFVVSQNISTSATIVIYVISFH